MSKDEARKIVADKFNGTHRVDFITEEKSAFVFLISAIMPDAVPDKMIVAVNKATGNTGFSIISHEDAIAKCS